jgi:hypothetical protein
MPIATEENIRWITNSWLGLHFTPEQAEELKKRLDLMTDQSASCPCAYCQSAESNQH